MGRETKWVRPRATEHCIKDVFGCITRVWSRHVCQADAAFRESVACSRIYLWSQVTLAVDEGSQTAKSRNASFVVLLHHFWGAANPLFCRISCSQRLLQCPGDPILHHDAQTRQASLKYPFGYRLFEAYAWGHKPAPNPFFMAFASHELLKISRFGSSGCCGAPDTGFYRPFDRKCEVRI